MAEALTWKPRYCSQRLQTARHWSRQDPENGTPRTCRQNTQRVQESQQSNCAAITVASSPDLLVVRHRSNVARVEPAALWEGRGYCAAKQGHVHSQRRGREASSRAAWRLAFRREPPALVPFLLLGSVKRVCARQRTSQPQESHNKHAELLVNQHKTESTKKSQRRSCCYRARFSSCALHALF